LKKNQRILIYRLGSIGDTIVALPCFHLIRKTFPASDRYVLTNLPFHQKASPVQDILKGTGLIQGWFDYPLKTRNPIDLLELRSKIVSWKPDVLIYLAAPRSRLSIIRDYLFFKTCGIRNIIGLPASDDLRNHRFDIESRLYEHEATRLARCLSSIGDAGLNERNSWDLQFTAEEEKKAVDSISVLGDCSYFFACCSGTKMPVKDWGQKNWEELICRLSERYADLGIAFIGSDDEKQRCDVLKNIWKGPAVNLCGKLSPRESAVVLRRSVMFLGHDSGPMHLASAVHTPCVAIFSARNKPAVWFPFGYPVRHRVIYHHVDCSGCNLEECTENGKKCINSITVNEVLENIELLKNRLLLF